MLTHYFDLRIYRAEEKTRGTRRRKPSKRRGVRRAKKKIHSLNTTDEGKMAISFQKNFSSHCQNEKLSCIYRVKGENTARQKTPYKN